MFPLRVYPYCTIKLRFNREQEQKRTKGCMKRCSCFFASRICRPSKTDANSLVFIHVNKNSENSTFFTQPSQSKAQDIQIVYRHPPYFMKPVSLSVQALLVPRILAAFWPICPLLSLPALFFSTVYFSYAAPRKRKAQLLLIAIFLLVQTLTALLTRISVPPALPSLLHEINRDNKKETQPRIHGIASLSMVQL